MIRALDGRAKRVVESVDRPRGSARLELVEGVRLLHPEDAVFEAMIQGWARQQQSRQLQPKTLQGREGVVRDFFQFTETYPWAWTPALVDEWSADLVGHRQMSVSTVRNYQQALRTALVHRISNQPLLRLARRLSGTIRHPTHPVLPRMEHNRPPDRVRSRSAEAALHPRGAAKIF